MRYILIAIIALVACILCASAFVATADARDLQLLVDQARGRIPDVMLIIPEFRSKQSDQFERVYIFTIVSQIITPSISIFLTKLFLMEREKKGAKDLSWPIMIILFFLSISVLIYYFYIFDGYSMVRQKSRIASLVMKDLFVSVMVPAPLILAIPVKWISRRK